MVKARIGDVIEYNRPYPVSKEVLGLCEGGVVVEGAYGLKFISRKEYQVIGSLKKKLFLKVFVPLSEERLKEETNAYCTLVK